MNLRELIDLIQSDILRLLPENENPSTFALWKKAFNPRFFPVFLVRLSRYCFLNKWLKILSPFITWLNVILFGIEFTPRCEIGTGLMLPHTVGTVVGAAKIGSNVTIFQGVTIGAISLDLAFNIDLRPQIGNNVLIGAGAKVLGGISIESDASIGANAVVLQSVPTKVTAVGVPAKHSINNQSL